MTSRTRNPNPILRTTLAALALLGPALLSARAAHAQQPPSPFDFVSQLDYECRPVDGMLAPPAPNLLVRQLNPVLIPQIPNQQAVLGLAQQLCVPVAKNGVIPSQPALDFIKWSDVICYKAEAPPVDVDLKLTHLNPVLANLPNEFVHLTELQQVCLPVRKNASVIPDAVSMMDRHVDLGCYGLLEPTSSADRPLWLQHLNPVIRAMQFPDRQVIMRRAQQLCVPIAKNNEPVPPGVRNVVRFADFLKYRVDLVQGPVPIFPLGLTHLNPLFHDLPQFPVTVENDPIRLMVPVAKNDNIPPKD